MNINDNLRKKLNLLWIPITFIPFFNGLGFIFAGLRVNNTRWIDEGIIYMIPFMFLTFTIFNDFVLYLELLMLIIGIIRAFMIYKPFLEKLEDKDDKKVTKDFQKINQKPQKTRTTNETSGLENKRIVDISVDDLINNTNFSSEKIEKIVEYRDSGYIFTSMDDFYQKINLNESERKELENLIIRKEKISNSRILDI